MSPIDAASYFGSPMIASGRDLIRQRLLAGLPSETSADREAALLDLPPPELDTTDYTDPTPGFVETFSGLQDQAIAPTDFLSGVVGGFQRGLGAAGTRAATRRAKLEESIAGQRKARDAANLQASRDYRLERGRRLSELSRNQRTERQKEAEFERDNPVVDDELIASYPGLSALRRMKGQRISRELLQREAFQTETGGGQKLVEVTNPDGSKTLVPSRPGLQTAPAGGATRPPTIEQGRASFFGSRAYDAMVAAEGGGLEQRILKKALGLNNPNLLQDDDQRAYTSAIQAFTLALNRLESGANVTPTEFSRVASLYFVQAGDKEADRQRKAALRQQTISALEKLQAPGAEAFGAAGTRVPGQAALSTPPIPPHWQKVRR